MKQMINYVLILVLIVTSSLYPNQAKLPEPYNSITPLPFNPKGHFGEHQQKGLSLLINKYNPKIVIEIGSYLGKSTRFIANLLPDDGKIYAIDHWLGSEEWQHKPEFQKEKPFLYQQFLSNVIHAKLTHKIIPIRMSSEEAEKIFDDMPDLIFIDGAHDYTSVYGDITRWYKHVEGHGILCGDDYGWGIGQPVKRAVDQFAREHRLKVKVINGWFWYYEK